MQDKALKEEQKQVYEIGYLLVSSIPEEKVAGEVASLKEVLSKKGAEFIGEENAELTSLAYTMTKKIGAANKRFDQGYFGWFKFELAKSEIESVKKSFEENPNMLRALIISTVKENTYLGKKAPAALLAKSEEVAAPEAPAEVAKDPAVSVEEMDKSIDEMVKEA